MRGDCDSAISDEKRRKPSGSPEAAEKGKGAINSRRGGKATRTDGGTDDHRLIAAPSSRTATPTPALGAPAFSPYASVPSRGRVLAQRRLLEEMQAIEKM